MAIHIAALTVLFTVVLGIAGFVAMVWFLVASRLAVPVLMLEDIRGIKAIRRALTLCRGYWWSVFGTQFLAGLLVSIVSAVVAVVLDAIFSAFHGGTTMSVVSGFFVQTIDYVVFAPFSAAILVVLTIDLRVRKEGFDIQLLSAQMGVPPTPSALFFTKPAPRDPMARAIHPRAIRRRGTRATRRRGTHHNPVTRHNRATRRKRTRGIPLGPADTRRRRADIRPKSRPLATRLHRHRRLAGHRP